MADTDPQLDALAKTDAKTLTRFAETLIDELGDIDVLHSRTGLVMLPMRDTAQGTVFHLGEVLVSEAHIRSGEIEGYGLRRGHDLEASMAMALIDLALQSGVQTSACKEFCETAATAQAEADVDTLRRIQATRVNMETF
ncbi:MULTISPECIES: phosphonate C-P lyase system protein PhnG [unclassified Shimia]|uniref:phosphonate C-P lyase system protein PhnG n=1 Tax=unclassified Shimia TaxID=2630038 RepID=UPI003101E15B